MKNLEGSDQIDVIIEWLYQREGGGIQFKEIESLPQTQFFNISLQPDGVNL